MSLRPPARTAKDYVLPFLIIVSLGIATVLTFQLWGLLRTDDGATSQFATTGEATLVVTGGEVEVYLPAAEAWKLVTGAGITVNATEKVRTSGTGSATLTFNDGTVLTLDTSTEVALVSLKNTLRRRAAEVFLVRGGAWVELGTTDRGDFVLTSDLLQVNAAEGAYLFTHDAEKSRTVFSAVIGGANVAVLDSKEGAKKPKLTTLIVEAGETVEVTSKHVNLLRIGGEIDLVQPTPAEITSATFYTSQMGEVVSPESDDAEDSTADSTTTADDTTASLEMPIITRPIGGNLTTTESLVKITGTVGSSAEKVQVSHNGSAPYTLAGFEAGDTTWQYNANADFANLVAGINTYKITALDAAGAKSPAATVTITYDPTESTTAEDIDTPDTSSDSSTGVPEVGGEVFGLPTVTFPVDGEIYTTDTIKFEGTVPEGTEFVEVNGYRLNQGFTGGTTWWYNASIEFENLEVGENEYEIEAISTDGTRKSVTIKINYQPAE